MQEFISPERESLSENIIEGGINRVVISSSSSKMI